jgi:hypothetical protein
MPDDPEYLSELWHDLDWSPWVPFDATREFWYIPKEPGLFRIRPVGKDFLMYIGETGQSLHKKLAEFRQALRRSDLMPWSDPHEAAPCLWAWWVEWVAALPPAEPRDEPLAEGEEPEPPASVMFEFSAAPLDASSAGRKGMEAFLLYQYRQDHGESPLCNFGRFHPRYRRSSLKKENRRGGKLANDQKDNPAGFPSIQPLAPEGKPGDPSWMGLEWTAPLSLTEENAGRAGPGAGHFLLLDAITGEVLLVGQSADVAKRLVQESRKERDGRALTFSYQILGQKVLTHNLRELECDLIGNFYEQNKKAPEFQYRQPGGP